MYRIDTIYIHHYVDTMIAAANQPDEEHAKIKKGILNINPNNLGIGPSFGAYYSPFNGFDVLLGFGVQYFFTSISLGRSKQRHPGFHHHK